MVELPIALYIVRSRTTMQTYVLANPSGDTDMVTDGLILLASVEQNELHILYAAEDEYSLGPYAATTLRARRENAKLNRHDLRPVSLDMNAISTTLRCVPFAFHDLIADGYADAIRELSIQEFTSNGGTVLDRRSIG
jgi:hypothetical protein